MVDTAIRPAGDNRATADAEMAHNNGTNPGPGRLHRLLRRAKSTKGSRHPGHRQQPTAHDLGGDGQSYPDPRLRGDHGAGVGAGASAGKTSIIPGADLQVDGGRHRHGKPTSSVSQSVGGATPSSRATPEQPGNLRPGVTDAEAQPVGGRKKRQTHQARTSPSLNKKPSIRERLFSRHATSPLPPSPPQPESHPHPHPHPHPPSPSQAPEPAEKGPAAPYVPRHAAAGFARTTAHVNYRRTPHRAKEDIPGQTQYNQLGAEHDLGSPHTPAQKLRRDELDESRPSESCSQEQRASPAPAPGPEMAATTTATTAVPPTTYRHNGGGTYYAEPHAAQTQTQDSVPPAGEREEAAATATAEDDVTSSDSQSDFQAFLARAAKEDQAQREFGWRPPAAAALPPPNLFYVRPEDYYEQAPALPDIAESESLDNGEEEQEVTDVSTMMVSAEDTVRGSQRGTTSGEDTVVNTNSSSIVPGPPPHKRGMIMGQHQHRHRHRLQPGIRPADED